MEDPNEFAILVSTEEAVKGWSDEGRVSPVAESELIKFVSLRCVVTKSIHLSFRPCKNRVCRGHVLQNAAAIALGLFAPRLGHDI